MPELNDIQTIVTTAQEAADPTPLPTDERFYSVLVPAGGRLEVIDIEKHLDDYRNQPRRKTGRVTIAETDSFIAYLAKHGIPATEVWANLDAATIKAVINAPTADAPAWGDHTATLQLRLTDDWSHWTSRDRKWLGQSDFAEHVEDHLPNFVEPAGAIMLEIAQSFRANTKVTFESSKRLANGETQLVFKEDVDAKAGRKGDMTIPESFTLGLIPFESGGAYKITARLRYRISNGDLLLSYVLDRPRDVLRDAFTGVLERIEDATKREVWHGTP